MRFTLLGPTYPYRGGIAHYTSLLTRALRREHETLLISFSRQYPRWLFPGRGDRDPSQNPLQVEAEYLLDPLNPLSWRRTLKRMEEWQPEVVVIPWWVPFWAPAWAVVGRGVRRLPGRPRLLFICHNVLPHEKSLIDRLALRLALSPGDGYIVHSQADAARLKQQFPAASLQVNPLPTYAGLGAQAAPLPAALPQDRPILLFFGFVRPYKGLDVLLEALPAILAQQPVHLLVAGEFWQGQAQYRAQITRLGIGEAVTILDRYLPDGELAACVKAADVAVLPYRSATQSAVVQVAFGQETPVITTHVGGLAEAVRHEETGLVVPPEDPAALAAAVNRFLAEDLGPGMVKNIRDEAERFSWEGLVEKLVVLGEGRVNRQQITGNE